MDDLGSSSGRSSNVVAVGAGSRRVKEEKKSASTDETPRRKPEEQRQGRRRMEMLEESDSSVPNTPLQKINENDPFRVSLKRKLASSSQVGGVNKEGAAQRSFEARMDGEAGNIGATREALDEYGLHGEMMTMMEEPSSPLRAENPLASQVSVRGSASSSVIYNVASEPRSPASRTSSTNLLEQGSPATPGDKGLSQTSVQVKIEGEGEDDKMDSCRSVPSVEEEMEEASDCEEDDEDDVGINPTSRKAAALKKQARLCSGKAKDDEKQNAAELKAVKKRLETLLNSSLEVELERVNDCIVENNEDCIDPNAVKRLEALFRKETMLLQAQTLIGWRCAKRGKVVIEDGRHRLLAFQNYLAERQESRRSKNQNLIDEDEVKVNVEILDGQPEARVRIMAALNTITSSVFQTAVRIRYLMAKLGMLHNPAITMQMSMTIINSIIWGGAKRPGDKGVPIYTFRAASMTDEEFHFIIANTRGAIDNKKTLLLYFIAKAVNPDKAFSILTYMDDAINANDLEDEYKKLEEMKCSVKDYLEGKGYDEGDALNIQERLLKCHTTYSTVRRLTSARNRLSDLPDVIDDFLIPLEKCLPPVTFIMPQVNIASNVEEAASTLHIFDSETFFGADVVNKVVLLIHSAHERSLNFIVIGGLTNAVGAALNRALEEHRRRKRQQNNTPDVAPQLFDIAVVQLSVDCAHFQDANGLWRNSLNACFFRSTHGAPLEHDILTQFMKKMKIGGRIERACLRLLSFDPTLDVSDNLWNKIFIGCSTPGPIAVAALSSNYRVTLLRTTGSSQFRRDLMQRQFVMDDKWTDFRLYKDNYTVDGRLRDPVTPKKKRARKNKMRNGVASGLVPPDNE